MFRLTVLISVLPSLLVLPLLKKRPENILVEKRKRGNTWLLRKQCEAQFTVCGLTFGLHVAQVHALLETLARSPKGAEHNWNES